MREDRPLIIFTSLAQMGAGIAAVQPLLWLVTGKFIWPGWIEVLTVSIMLLAGMTFSLAHLGRKKRMFFVLLRINQSALSIELLLAGVTLAAALATFFWYRTVPFFAWRMTIVAALLLLVTMGLVYRLGGQVAWKGAAVVTPLLTGMLWGSLFHLAVTSSTSESLLMLVSGFTGLDILLMVMRWKQIEKSVQQGQPRNAALFRKRHKLIIIRLLVSDLMTLSALFALGPSAALISNSAGIFIDRYLFYALGIQCSTEAEISRVESVIPDL